MFYFYRVLNDNIQIINSDYDLSKENEKCILLKDKEYFEFKDAYQNNKLLYIDKTGNLQIRDKLTKYDESTDTWIPDQDAIDADNIQKENNRQEQLKSQAKQDLTDTSWMVDTDTFAEYTQVEQSQILTYRKYLRDVMNGKIDLTGITKLKTLEDF